MQYTAICVKKIAQEESKEAIALAKAGSELIRIALNSKNAALALPYIRQNLDESGFENVPLVGCGQIAKEFDELGGHFNACPCVGLSFQVGFDQV